eukprot:8297227-Ditylum_brightwellii.AAC.1
MDEQHSKPLFINSQELINGMLRSKSKRASCPLENGKDKATIHSRSIVQHIGMHMCRWKQHLNM